MSKPENPELFESYAQRLSEDGPVIHGYSTELTLRDLFAALIAAGEQASPDHYETPDNIASYAYKCADAMLAERAKGEEGDG